jgi:DNA-binding SARP family transcriptional activator
MSCAPLSCPFVHEDVAVRVLGPLQVDGVAPRSPTARAVLAWTVLNAGRRVRIEACARALWPALPLATAVRRVRDAARVLGAQLPDRLAVTATTLELIIAPQAIDEHRFRALVTAAVRPHRIDGARSQLGEALQLWRGAPYPDLARVEQARDVIADLRELQLAATEHFFAAAVTEAVDYRLVAQLRAAVRRHPLRERLWRQLAIALFLTSRRAEGLAQIDECRRTLASFGLRATPAMDKLYLAILRGDAASARIAA